MHACHLPLSPPASCCTPCCATCSECTVLGCLQEGQLVASPEVLLAHTHKPHTNVAIHDPCRLCRLYTHLNSLSDRPRAACQQVRGLSTMCAYKRCLHMQKFTLYWRPRPFRSSRRASQTTSYTSMQSRRSAVPDDVLFYTVLPVLQFLPVLHA